MKPLMLTGAILAAFGIVALAVRFMRFSNSENFPRDGSVQVTVKQEKVISIPPAVGGLALAGGVALMILAARK